MSNKKNQDLPAFLKNLYDYKRMQKDIEMILIPLNVFSNYAYCVKISYFYYHFTNTNLNELSNQVSMLIIEYKYSN